MKKLRISEIYEIEPAIQKAIVEDSRNEELWKSVLGFKGRKDQWVENAQKVIHSEGIFSIGHGNRDHANSSKRGRSERFI